MKKFAIIGAAGFIAPKHVQAIQDVGGELVAAYDISDSVGYLDRYFRHCEFFTKVGSFSRCIKSAGVDYVVICTPSNLHTIQTCTALHSGFDVICEKPLGLNPKELDYILAAEAETGKRVWTILQLIYNKFAEEFRLHYTNSSNHQFRVDYFSPRGDWYHKSWKGNSTRSGGLVMNIGVHIIHLLVDVFGIPKSIHTRKSTTTRYEADFIFKKGNAVNLILDIDKSAEPTRRIVPEGDAVLIYDLGNEFPQNLHTKAYQGILDGQGFGVEEIRPSIEIINRIHNAKN